MFCAWAPELTNCRQALSRGAASPGVATSRLANPSIARSSAPGPVAVASPPSAVARVCGSALRSVAACRRMSPAGGVTVPVASILTMGVRNAGLWRASRSKSGARRASRSRRSEPSSALATSGSAGSPASLTLASTSPPPGGRTRLRSRSCIRRVTSAAAGAGVVVDVTTAARRIDRMRALSSQATGS